MGDPASMAAGKVKIYGTTGGALADGVDAGVIIYVGVRDDWDGRGGRDGDGGWGHFWWLLGVGADRKWLLGGGCRGNWRTSQLTASFVSKGPSRVASRNQRGVGRWSQLYRGSWRRLGQCSFVGDVAFWCLLAGICIHVPTHSG